MKFPVLSELIGVNPTLQEPELQEHAVVISTFQTSETSHVSAGVKKPKPWESYGRETVCSYPFINVTSDEIGYWLVKVLELSAELDDPLDAPQLAKIALQIKIKIILNFHLLIRKAYYLFGENLIKLETYACLRL